MLRDVGPEVFPGKRPSGRAPTIGETTSAPRRSAASSGGSRLPLAGLSHRCGRDELPCRPASGRDPQAPAPTGELAR